MSPQQSRTRATAQGSAVRDALIGQDGFRSAQSVYAVLRTDGHKIGLSTVYRHLQALTDDGVVDVIHNPDGETVYRYCGETPGGHHHHVVCRSCGRAEEVEGSAVERWADEIAAQAGFVDVDHTVEVFGLCPQCAAL